MMRAVIFAGPSLPPSARPSHAWLDWRPPARQGDLYRSALEHPASIGLIDGYFNGSYSVWHKEVLWAMEQGINVYGAASLGAVRAAELAQFGMIGVGRIFESFRDGILVDDDELALLHGPAETDYVPVTEPMVNIRATLAAAAKAGVISMCCATALTAAAKARSYESRTYNALLTDDSSTAMADREKLRRWLPHGRVDVKREDALALIERLGRRPLRQQPAGVSYDLAVTPAWSYARRQMAEIEVSV